MKSVIGLIIFVLFASWTQAGPPAPPMIRPPMVPPTGMPMVGHPSKENIPKDGPLEEAKNLEQIVERMKVRQENSLLTTKPEKVKDLVIVTSILFVVFGALFVSALLILLHGLSDKNHPRIVTLTYVLTTCACIYIAHMYAATHLIKEKDLAQYKVTVRIEDRDEDGYLTFDVPTKEGNKKGKIKFEETRPGDEVSIWIVSTLEGSRKGAEAQAIGITQFEGIPILRK